MTRAMRRALVWKEWRETRWRWLAFVLAFHLPALIGTFVVLFNERVRFDLAVSTDQMAVTALNLALIVQSGFVLSAGLFLLAFFASAAVAPEIASHEMFFLFERPIRRREILRLKFLVGLIQAILCVGFSILTTLALVYLGLLVLARGGHAGRVGKRLFANCHQRSSRDTLDGTPRRNGLRRDISLLRDLRKVVGGRDRRSDLARGNVLLFGRATVRLDSRQCAAGVAGAGDGEPRTLRPARAGSPCDDGRDHRPSLPGRSVRF